MKAASLPLLRREFITLLGGAAACRFLSVYLQRSKEESSAPRLMEGSVASLRLRYCHALKRESAVSSLPALGGFDDLDLRVLIEIEDHFCPARQLDHKLQ
jgi:hypothetical protein